MIELLYSIKYKFKTRKINKLIGNTGNDCMQCNYSKYHVFGICLKFSIVSDTILSVILDNNKDTCVYKSHYRGHILAILDTRGCEISSEY